MMEGERGRRRRPPPKSEELGYGSYGKVGTYVVDGKIDENTVIKRFIAIPNTGVSLSFIEYEILSKCNHPNIIKCKGLHKGPYSIGENDELDGEVHLLLEKADGTLNNLVDNKYFSGEEKTTRIIKILSDILLGLEYLHHNGIMHRDMGGANILITKDLQAKLCDFGMSSLCMTKMNGTYVNVGYRCPEQYTNQSYDTGIDIWSVAIILLQMINGENKFNPPMINDIFDTNPYNVISNVVQNYPLTLGINEMSNWVEKINSGFNEKKKKSGKTLFKNVVKTHKHEEIMNKIPEEFREFITLSMSWYSNRRATASKLLNLKLFDSLRNEIDESRNKWLKKTIEYSYDLHVPSSSIRDIVHKVTQTLFEYRMPIEYIIHGVHLYYDFVKYNYKLNLNQEQIILLCCFVSHKYFTTNSIPSGIDSFTPNPKLQKELLASEKEFLEQFNYVLGRHTLLNCVLYRSHGGHINQVYQDSMKELLTLMTSLLKEGTYNTKDLIEQISNC